MTDPDGLSERLDSAFKALSVELDKLEKKRSRTGLDEDSYKKSDEAWAKLGELIKESDQLVKEFYLEFPEYVGEWVPHE